MMDALPDKLISIVFDYLNVLDLISCRLVNKQFRSLIDAVKPTELIVDKNWSPLDDETKWYMTNDHLNLRNRIFISSPLLLQSFPFDLSKLRRLKINFLLNCNRFDFAFFDRLVDLEHLEIHSITRFLDDQVGQRVLVLRSVKVLYIEKVFDHLRIAAPRLKLSKLFCRNGKRLIELLRPRSVERPVVESMDTSTETSCESIPNTNCKFGGNTVNRNSNNEMSPGECGQLSIQRFIENLEHAYRCRETNCASKSCERIKRVLSHNRTCKMKSPNDHSKCSICAQLISLCNYHAKQCIEPSCELPYCIKFKIRVPLEQMMESMSIDPQS